MNGLARILMADDDENDVELALAALDEHNLANRVDVVRDGSEVLDYLYCRGKFATRTNEILFVLLDLKMPKVGGLDVLRQMHDDPDLVKPPVIVLSSSAEDPDIAASYALGANAYVVKPVQFEQFHESVRQLGFFWAILNTPPPKKAS